MFRVFEAAYLVCIMYAAIATDALGIYSTYIALNATSPVGIPDNLRQEVEGIII